MESAEIACWDIAIIRFENKRKNSKFINDDDIFDDLSCYLFLVLDIATIINAPGIPRFSGLQMYYLASKSIDAMHPLIRNRSLRA
jgi:hypothetical protein